MAISEGLRSIIPLELYSSSKSDDNTIFACVELRALPCCRYMTSQQEPRLSPYMTRIRLTTTYAIRPHLTVQMTWCSVMVSCGTWPLEGFVCTRLATHSNCHVTFTTFYLHLQRASAFFISVCLALRVPTLVSIVNTLLVCWQTTMNVFHLKIDLGGFRNWLFVHLLHCYGNSATAINGILGN